MFNATVASYLFGLSFVLSIIFSIKFLGESQLFLFVIFFREIDTGIRIPNKSNITFLSIIFDAQLLWHVLYENIELILKEGDTPQTKQKNMQFGAIADIYMAKM